MARDVVLTLLALVALAVALAVAADLGLRLDGKETVSQWLRQNPEYFFIPALLTILFLALLGIHLWT